MQAATEASGPSHLFGDGRAATRKVVLAGQPRAVPPAATGGPELHHPKELLLALARPWLGATEIEVSADNPHYMELVDWSAELAVLHGGALDLACPVPLARNALLLDAEDLRGLAEEGMTGDRFGLRQRRIALMDRLLSLVPAEAARGLLPEDRVAPVPVGALLAHAPALSAAVVGGARRLPRPVRWLVCDLESGPYNFLALKREFKLGSSHVPALFQAAARGDRPGLVAFVTPGTLGDLGPVLRAFRALEEGGSRAQLFVFFFGSPEDFAASLAARPYAMFFGDNFRAPGIRFLFAPFAPADVLEALAAAAGSIDTAYGGVLDALAAEMGLRHRLVIGPDGSFDLWRAGGVAAARGIAWGSLYEPATLSRRRYANSRAGERTLVNALADMV